MFRFFSHVGYYRILSKVPCAIQWVLTEAKAIKNRWQEYTEELYKKGLHDPDNHDGVITYLEPDILEFKVSGP